MTNEDFLTMIASDIAGIYNQMLKHVEDRPACDRNRHDIERIRLVRRTLAAACGIARDASAPGLIYEADVLEQTAEDVKELAEEVEG